MKTIFGIVILFLMALGYIGMFGEIVGIYEEGIEKPSFIKKLIFVVVAVIVVFYFVYHIYIIEKF